MVGLDRWALGDSTHTNKTISVLWNNHSLQLGEKGRWGKIRALGASHVG